MANPLLRSVAEGGLADRMTGKILDEKVPDESASKWLLMAVVTGWLNSSKERLGRRNAVNLREDPNKKLQVERYEQIIYKSVK